MLPRTGERALPVDSILIPGLPSDNGIVTSRAQKEIAQENDDDRDVKNENEPNGNL